MQRSPSIARFGSRRRLLAAVGLLFLAGVLLALIGWREAHAGPIVRTASIALADWPAGEQPLQALLISDLHFCSPTMGASRVTRIRAQLRRLEPDLVLVAGDFVGRDSVEGVVCTEKAIAGFFGGWKPPLGVAAVLGNHDYWSDPAAITRALRAAGVTVADNSATRKGPLLIGLVGDGVSGNAKLGGSLNALARLQREKAGATIYLTHSPDLARWVPGRDALLLAGHTHCGQIVLPVVEHIRPVSDVNGNRLRCGRVRRGNVRGIVTGGIGTSLIPFRINAPPDLWMIKFGPPVQSPAPPSGSPHGVVRERKDRAFKFDR